MKIRIDKTEVSAKSPHLVTLKEGRYISVDIDMVEHE